MSICSTCTKHQTTFKPQNDNQRIHGSLHTLAANLSHLIHSHFFSVNWCSKQDFPTPISPARGHHPTMYLDCKCCLYTHTDYDVLKNVGIVVRTGSHFCSIYCPLTQNELLEVSESDVWGRPLPCEQQGWANERDREEWRGGLAGVSLGGGGETGNQPNKVWPYSNKPVMVTWPKHWTTPYFGRTWLAHDFTLLFGCTWLARD